MKRLGIITLGLLALLAGLLAPASTGTAAAAAPASKVSAVSAKRADGTQVRQVNLVYRGSANKPVTTRSATIPGIGDVDIFCRANSTMIRLYTADRRYETQMWTQKYEQKSYGDAVSVKNARIFRYAHADDDGDGGTGFYTNEGFNQQSPPETFSKGYMNGIISQRSSRSPGFANGQIAEGNLKPVTTFELDWYWENMREPERFRYCKVRATFTTVLAQDQRMTLTWHGENEAAGNERRAWTVPGIGQLAATCADNTTDDKTLTITPASQDAQLYVETVTGEGRVDDHVDTSGQDQPDPTTGAFTPVRLPPNGTLRIKATVGGVERWFLVSSYYVTNDRFGPRRNVCELAVGAYDATFS